jgi:hypothetical protein
VEEVLVGPSDARVAVGLREERGEIRREQQAEQRSEERR